MMLVGELDNWVFDPDRTDWGIIFVICPQAEKELARLDLSDLRWQMWSAHGLRPEVPIRFERRNGRQEVLTHIGGFTRASF